MAKNWIRAAIKHPGAFRAQAKRAGKSVSAYIREVLAPGSHASATTKRRAQLARTLRRLRR